MGERLDSTSAPSSAALQNTSRTMPAQMPGSCQPCAHASQRPQPLLGHAAACLHAPMFGVVQHISPCLPPCLMVHGLHGRGMPSHPLFCELDGGGIYTRC